LYKLKKLLEKKVYWSYLIIRKSFGICPIYFGSKFCVECVPNYFISGSLVFLRNVVFMLFFFCGYCSTHTHWSFFFHLIAYWKLETLFNLLLCSKNSFRENTMAVKFISIQNIIDWNNLTFMDISGHLVCGDRWDSNYRNKFRLSTAQTTQHLEMTDCRESTKPGHIGSCGYSQEDLFKHRIYEWLKQ